MKLKILLFILILISIETVCCETLTFDQKLEIFNSCIINCDYDFYIFLLSNCHEIIGHLDTFNSSQEIKLYVQLLETDFYKN